MIFKFLEFFIFFYYIFIILKIFSMIVLGVCMNVCESEFGF